MAIERPYLELGELKWPDLDYSRHARRRRRKARSQAEIYAELAHTGVAERSSHRKKSQMSFFLGLA